MPQQCMAQSKDPCLSRWQVNTIWGHTVFQQNVNASEVIADAALTFVDPSSPTFQQRASNVLEKFVRQYPDAAKIAAEDLKERARLANYPIALEATNEIQRMLEINKTRK